MRVTHRLAESVQKITFADCPEEPVLAAVALFLTARDRIEPDPVQRDAVRSRT